MRHKSSRRLCGLYLFTLNPEGEPARILALASVAFWLLVIVGCSHAPKEVDDAALRAGDSDAANWITYGRAAKFAVCGGQAVLDGEGFGDHGEIANLAVMRQLRIHGIQRGLNGGA